MTIHTSKSSLSVPATFLLLLVVFHFTQAEEDEKIDESFYSCIPGLLSSAGVSLPRGDISKLVLSDPFTLTCHLNPRHKFYSERGFRAKDLEFFVKASTNGNQFIDHRLKSRIVNETTIEATYDPAIAGSRRIECKVKVPDSNEYKGVCTQTVHVGFAPQGPVNFSCISYNWQNLNCTWSEPYNPIKSKYQLVYKDGGNYGRGQVAHCPRNTSKIGNCIWDHRTEPLFRQPLMNLELVMNVSNILHPNGILFSYLYDLKKIVKPKMMNMTLLPVGPHEILLHTTLDSNLHFFPPGFYQLTRFKSEFDDKWEEMNSDVSSEVSTSEFRISGLVPYTKYIVEVRLRSSRANPLDTNLWSDKSVGEVTTLPIAPAKTPSTNIGSFEILEDRSVYIYWKKINKTDENGPDFRYRITEVNEDGAVIPLVPKEITSSYAFFPKLQKGSYTFQITSENQEGTAPDTSRVYVPPESERNIQPLAVTKIAFSAKLFEVSWLPPVKLENIKNYTVYWCKPKNNRDRPYQCEGELDWIYVSNSSQSVNVSLPTENVYQFAVSANTEEISSGMVWVTCTILHNKVTSQIRKVRIDFVESRSMKVSWHLECSNRVGIIKGYNITYCPVIKPGSTICKEEADSLVAPPNAETFTLINLEPWTTYKVSVAVITPAGLGATSSFLTNTTLPDRPETPENFDIVEITSQTLKLTWSPPRKMNGPGIFYSVRLQYKNFKNEKISSEEISTELSMTLNNLKVNTKYDVMLCSCTKLNGVPEPLCSLECATKYARTDIGFSSMMAPPIVTFVNSTEVKVTWDTNNFHHGGPQIDYEVKIVHHHKQNVHILRTNSSRAKTNFLQIALDRISEDKDWSPNCHNSSSMTNMYNFSVRAVTVDNLRGLKFEPPWSLDEVVPAYCTISTLGTVVILLLAIIPVGVVAFLFFFCRFYNWGSRTFVLFKDVSKEVSNKNKKNDQSLADSNVTQSQHIDQLDHEMHEWLSKSEHNQSKADVDCKETTQELLDQHSQKERGSSDSSSGCGSVCPSYHGGEGPENYTSPSDTKVYPKSKVVSQDFDESASLGLGNSLSSNLFNVDWTSSQPQVQSSPFVSSMISSPETVFSNENNPRAWNKPSNGYVSFASARDGIRASQNPDSSTKYPENVSTFKTNVTKTHEILIQDLKSHLAIQSRASLLKTDVERPLLTDCEFSKVFPGELHMNGIPENHPALIKCGSTGPFRTSTMV